MSFTFQYNPDHPHQIEAIEAVIDVLAGLPSAEHLPALVREDEIFANAPQHDELAPHLLEPNLHEVQQRHNQRHPDAVIPTGQHLAVDDGPMLEGVCNDSSSCYHLTIEMETGTGKTYVYLRTLYELHKRYGLRKFLIVVPSIAISEGVKASFKSLHAHFIGLYGKTNFALQEYDGDRPGLLRSFASSTTPTILLMTQQSFNRANNNFYKSTEKLAGELRPFQWVQGTRPVVVLDEPQNMGTERACEALRTLKPLLVLRYSATHRQGQQPNPVYRLTPVQAFRLGLVKQIEVIGIAELGVLNAQLLRLEEVRRNPISAVLRALTLDQGKTSAQLITVKQGDDLARKTHLPEHKGLVVSEIRVGRDGEQSMVVFETGLELATSDEVVGSRRAVWQAQIDKTLQTHFARQRQLQPLGIKVLSLFFIDRVANYVDETGVIRQLFDECFERLKQHDPYFCRFAAADVREGYFAKSKVKGKEVLLDEVKADSAEAKAAFRLIMAGKERLLSFPDGQDPGKQVAFLFAHSALREGWDNPNVFQICTLNQTGSPMKKRQEIGRGLRLCVDQQGRRPEQIGINVLTVIANESYESYVANLQQDYIDEGLTPPPPPGGARKPEALRRDDLYRGQEFRHFWRRLCQRLSYRLEIDTHVLIEDCVAKLLTAPFPAPMLTVSRGRFVISEYVLRLSQLISPTRAQILVERRTTEPRRQASLGVVQEEETRIEVQVKDDLAKLCKNPHLRGFKVTKLWQQYGEPRLLFANDIEISPSEPHAFQANQVDKHRDEELLLSSATYPVPDFISRAAEETSLTRETLLQIFAGMNQAQQAKLFKNPEGWSNVFIETIKECLAEHIAERVRYVDTGQLLGDPDNPDDYFQPSTKHPQRELIEGGQRSLYSRVQIDSEVERQFVEDRLRQDEEQVRVYFKFPPKFKIALPKIIGNYNPDWGIVRLNAQGQATLELVRETKGSEHLDQLRFQNEGRKVKMAARYFAKLGIDYRVVTGQTPQYWQAASDLDQARQRRLVSIVSREQVRPGKVAVPVYSLQAAAGAFSQGQEPTVIGYVELPRAEARQKGLFVAQIVGDSMERLAPSAAYCLWQHLGAADVVAAQPGEAVVVRRPGGGDPELGEFTFKRWQPGSASGAVLEPMSRDPRHQAIAVGDNDALQFVARFLKDLGSL